MPTSGRHAAATLFGAIAPATGQVLVAEAERASTGSFAAFLETVCQAFPGRRIHLIVDNSKIHHAKALQPYLAARPELVLHFLPPYSPQLNNVERLWKWLREGDSEHVLGRSGRHRGRDRSGSAWLPSVPDEVRSRLCGMPA